jgi:hypothetical protein
MSPLRVQKVNTIHRFVTTVCYYNYHNSGHGVGVGVLLAADSQSTSSSGYQASLWDP